VRIFLVEDEPALLALVGRQLERDGHAVTRCGSAEEAREAIAAGAAWPDVLVVDETLPGESGSAMAGDWLTKVTGMGCVLCSGYPLSLDLLPEPARGRAVILQKPYLPAMLREALEAAGRL
jgi:DNA-binding NtrC family response regulator